MICFSVEKVDQYNMECTWRVVRESALTYICSLWEVEGGDLVSDIHDGGTRTVLPQLPFDGAYQVVLQADVGCQCNYGHVINEYHFPKKNAIELLTAFCLQRNIKYICCCIEFVNNLFRCA